MQPCEDRFITKCLAQIGINYFDTTDRFGSQRFIGFSPSHIMDLETTKNDFRKETATLWGRIRNETSGISSNETLGISIMSEALTGFHWFRKEHEMRRVHALLYPGICPSNSSVDNTLKTLPGK